ncbi:hypothetical protein MD484_g34, partial [Candolleomyces efflorescens]
MATNPLAAPSPLKDVIHPQFHQNTFPAEFFAKTNLGLKLDKDDQICRLALTPAGCPLGPLHCPLRHTQPSAQNFQLPRQPPTHPRERERLSTVCKHWLRGLCKKGDACEFLHEYNLRRMPECWWFAKYGYCSAGDECLYAHPKERRIECPDYNRGFCKLVLVVKQRLCRVLHDAILTKCYVSSVEKEDIMQITAEIEMSQVTEVVRNVHGDMTNDLFVPSLLLLTPLLYSILCSA